ncbi:MAG: hypothetical protein ABI990_04895 [Actinomycetota bacterium]
MSMNMPCTQTQTATLADFQQPGDSPPSPQFALTDNVTFTIMVQAIAK